ncbi:MAG: tetratricopeptide repeat protein [bacterium]
MLNKIIWKGVIAFLVFTGCAGNFSTAKKGKSRLMVPAGVDSSVAIKADSLSRNLFVSLNRENRADNYKALGAQNTSRSDTLWKYLSNKLDPSIKISVQDSLAAIRAFNKGALNLQKFAKMQQSSKPSQSLELFKLETLKLLQNARKYFEQALILNPFDLETKSWLARVYQSLAARFLDDDNHARAIKILENLLHIEKGEHALYGRLAESHYALKHWQAAHFHFQKAESVLRETAGLDFTHSDYTQDVALDTAALFYYVYYQGDTEIKMHLAARGTKSLQRALTYASSQQERDDILSYIEWINWDDGNVEAVELRDKYLALQEKKEYGQAAKGLLRLIPKLKTRRAIDEIVWRLAVLEYQFLQRQDAAMERLKQVVKLASKDQNGAPLDSTYQKYFDSYGIMCHNSGLENYTKNRKFAFMYFQQAVAIDWRSRAKSHLEIAKLSRNNPRAVIENCQQALKALKQLDPNEKLQVYQLMVEALKRTGQFDQARTYYGQWIGLKKSSQRSSRR